MIGVPLSGGKTLNVTFRSLNTRDDVFKSYNHTSGNSPPMQKLNSNTGLRGLQAAYPTPANTVVETSGRQSRSMVVNTRPALAPASSIKHDYSQHVTEQIQEEDSSGMIGEQRKEELKKVVQLGVMRGLSSNKQIRKNSRTSRLMPQTQEKMYMQIKMRNDGVVPFQNATSASPQAQMGHQRNQTQQIAMQPFYLTGVSGFHQIRQENMQTPKAHPAATASMKGRQSTHQQLSKATGAGAAQVTSTSRNDGRNMNHLNVSQMGSQTSTDKFGGDGTKNTQTNQSINDTFELTNMIGGASIEIQEKDGHHTQSLDYPNQQEFCGVRNEHSGHAATIQQQHQHNSKLEEANSSIDQPSFQTEHEATFLWNNAKIIQNSLSGNSPQLAPDRSPSGNRKSHDFAFDSFMGAQKKSHNLSLDSPRKKKGPGKGATGNELIQSHRIEHHIQSPGVNLEGVIPHMVGHSMHHTYHAHAQEQVMDRISLSPPLQQVKWDNFRNAAAKEGNSRPRRATQNNGGKNRDLMPGQGIHAPGGDPMKNSTTLSPRKQQSTRESIQERFKLATMNQLIPSRVDNQIGPIQGHSMQLVKSTAVDKKTMTQQPTSVPRAECEKEAQVQDYEAMILANPSKPTSTENSQAAVPPLTPGPKKISKISVDDLHDSITGDKGLSKTETQVGAIGVADRTQSLDGRDKANESPRLTTLGPITEAKSPDTLVKQFSTERRPQQMTGESAKHDGGVAVGRLGRFNTILLPNVGSTSARHRQSEHNRADTVIDGKEAGAPLPDLSPAEPPSVEQVVKNSNIPVIACQITSTTDDKQGGRVISTSIRHSSRHDDMSGAQEVQTATTKQVVATSNAGGGANQGVAKLVSVSQAPGDPGSGLSKPDERGKLAANQQATAAKGANNNLIVLKSATSANGDAKQDSQEGGKADLAMDISSYAANTKYSSTGVPSDGGAIKYHETLSGDDMLTSAALQQKIGNLALCFPNSQTKNSFKRVNNQEQQVTASDFEGRAGASPGNPQYPANKPRTGDRQCRRVMQIKPDLCNINPDDLDETTIRNMHAIGINFATRATNKMKPYETHATKKRKWRNYFSSERGYSTQGSPKARDGWKERVPSPDYDGTSSNAENLKILQRRLAAWPTGEQGSGIGNEPDKLVGATLSSNPLDYCSYASDLHNFAKGHDSNTNEAHLLSSLPNDVRQLQTPAMVKSAVGSSRNKAKIQVRTLIEKSQAQGFSNTQQILDSSGKARNLQTQGCQRSSLKMKHSLPPQQYHPQIISGANSVTASNSKDVVSEKTNYFAGTNVATDKKFNTIDAKNNSMMCTPAYLEATTDQKNMTQTGTKFLRQRRAKPHNLGQNFRTMHDDQSSKEEFGDSQGKKFATFSLQVRRRTDQQSNFLNRTNNSWYNGPIEVEDQRLSQKRQQRSVDVTESFKMLKARKIAQMYRDTARHPVMKDTSTAAKDMADSIHGSQISMQFDDAQTNNKSVNLTDNQLNPVQTQKFQFVPKTAAVSHRMKGFCCNVPINGYGRLPYQNTQSQRPGLSPKTPAIRHGIFGPSIPASVNASKTADSSVMKKKDKEQGLKQFARPMIMEAEKCQMTLHTNINNALRAKQKAPKVLFQEDREVKNRVNRADLRQLHAYNTFKGRVQSLHVPKLLSQLTTTSPTSEVSNNQLQTALNDPDRVNAYAVLNFARDEMPGSLNGRKLHTSQLSVTPELRLDIMLQQQP